MNLDVKTIEAMAAAGIEFTAGISAPGGGWPVYLTAKDVPRFIEDREQFGADHFGVTKIQYREWVETDGCVRCSGKTTKGERCRNLVSGPVQLQIDEWLKRDGSYCVLHGGESAEEARIRGGRV